MVDDNKTEQPTQKKLDDSRKKANVPFSKETVNLFMMFCYTLLFVWVIPGFSQKIVIFLRQFVGLVYQLDMEAISFLYIGEHIFPPFIVILLVVFVFAVFASIVQNGFLLSTHSIKPRWEKISVIKGLGRIFSVRSVVDTLLSVVKLFLLVCVVYFAVRSHLSGLDVLHSFSVEDILSFAHKMALYILVGVLIIMCFVALIDITYKRLSHKNKLMMSKHEIKEEFKQTEVSQEVKKRIKAIHSENIKQSVMKDIAGSDVVIVNPDHYAVALKYDLNTMPAPRIMARGQGHVALKIKKIAIDNNVFVIQNKVLAQSLFRSSKVGDYIPETHYKVVAEIINYVYRIQKRNMNQGPDIRY